MSDVVKYENPAAEARKRRDMAAMFRRMADAIESDRLAARPSGVIVATVHEGGHGILHVGLRRGDLESAAAALRKKSLGLLLEKYARGEALPHNRTLAHGF